MVKTRAHRAHEKAKIKAQAKVMAKAMRKAKAKYAYMTDDDSDALTSEESSEEESEYEDDENSKEEGPKIFASRSAEEILKPGGTIRWDAYSTTIFREGIVNGFAKGYLPTPTQLSALASKIKVPFWAGKKVVRAILKRLISTIERCLCPAAAPGLIINTFTGESRNSWRIDVSQALLHLVQKPEFHFSQLRLKTEQLEELHQEFDSLFVSLKGSGEAVTGRMGAAQLLNDTMSQLENLGKLRLAKPAEVEKILREQAEAQVAAEQASESLRLAECYEEHVQSMSPCAVSRISLPLGKPKPISSEKAIHVSTSKRSKINTMPSPPASKQLKESRVKPLTAPIAISHDDSTDREDDETSTQIDSEEDEITDEGEGETNDADVFGNDEGDTTLIGATAGEDRRAEVEIDSRARKLRRQMIDAGVAEDAATSTAARLACDLRAQRVVTKRFEEPKSHVTADPGLASGVPPKSTQKTAKKCLGEPSSSVSKPTTQKLVTLDIDEDELAAFEQFKKERAQKKKQASKSIPLAFDGYNGTNSDEDVTSVIFTTPAKRTAKNKSERVTNDYDTLSTTLKKEPKSMANTPTEPLTKSKKSTPIRFVEDMTLPRASGRFADSDQELMVATPAVKVKKPKKTKKIKQ